MRMCAYVYAREGGSLESHLVSVHLSRRIQLVCSAASSFIVGRFLGILDSFSQAFGWCRLVGFY